MRHIFSLWVMIPAITLFSLCNGLIFCSVSNDILYLGTAIFGLGSAMISVVYGSFIQGAGTMFVKGAKWVGLIVYTLCLISSVAGYISTYEKSTLHPQTIENLKYIFSNFMFATGYGIIGLIWSFITTKHLGLYRRLPNRKEETEFIQIEN